jgi:hypothetical protein
MSLTAIEGRGFNPPPSPSASPSPTPSTTAPTSVGPDPIRDGSAPSPFSRLLRALSAEIDRGEHATHAAIRSARKGADLSTVDLIALQAQIYRYVEAVDLASKLVDRAANGVRTVVQAQ